MKNMQLSFMVFALIFVGCSSVGYFQANHNGRYYLQQMNRNMHMQNIDRSLQGINNSLNRMSNPYWYGY